MTCTGDAETSDAPLVWHVGANYAYSFSRLRLSNDEKPTVERRMLTAALERRLGERWAIRVGGGATLNGAVDVADDHYDLLPGFVFFLGGSFRITEGRGYAPFVLVDLNGAASSGLAESLTEKNRLTAFDARLSVTVGKLFANTFAPYLVARAFGGPVLWERGGASVTGSDRYHVQLGAGVLVTAGRVDAFAEIVPLGEQTATVGLSTSF